MDEASVEIKPAPGKSLETKQPENPPVGLSPDKKPEIPRGFGLNNIVKHWIDKFSGPENQPAPRLIENIRKEEQELSGALDHLAPLQKKPAGRIATALVAATIAMAGMMHSTRSAEGAEPAPPPAQEQMLASLDRTDLNEFKTVSDALNNSAKEFVKGLGTFSQMRLINEIKSAKIEDLEAYVEKGDPKIMENAGDSFKELIHIYTDGLHKIKTDHPGIYPSVEETILKKVKFIQTHSLREISQEFS